MSYTLQVQSEAVIDIQEAFEWYEAQQPGLGYELIEEIESGFEKLGKHPLYYTAINERFRRLKIYRFPYLMVYEVEGNTVIINAVHHTSKESRF